MQNMLELAQDEGLDLTTDSINYMFTYPDKHPGILVNVTIGGMFFNEDVEPEEIH